MTNSNIEGRNSDGGLAFVGCYFKSKPECDTCDYLGSHNDDYYGMGKDIPEWERSCFACGYDIHLTKPACWSDLDAADTCGIPVWLWRVRSFLPRRLGWWSARRTVRELARVMGLVESKRREG